MTTGAEVRHAERGALHFGLVQKFGGDNDRDRPSERFESDSVMRTARRARPSIADRGQDDVVLGGDCRHQRRVGGFGKTFLAVVVDRGELVALAEQRRRLAQEPAGIPFGVVENAERWPRARTTRGAGDTGSASTRPRGSNTNSNSLIHFAVLLRCAAVPAASRVRNTRFPPSPINSTSHPRIQARRSSRCPRCCAVPARSCGPSRG